MPKEWPASRPLSALSPLVHYQSNICMRVVELCPSVGIIINYSVVDAYETQGISEELHDLMDETTVLGHRSFRLLG